MTKLRRNKKFWIEVNQDQKVKTQRFKQITLAKKIDKV